MKTLFYESRFFRKQSGTSFVILLLKKIILIYISLDISTGKHGNTFLHELSLEMYLHKTYRNPVYGSEHTNKHAYLITNLPFNLAAAGSSVQTISASDLLKQQKEQHQQRMLARKKRAEEIQKRWEAFVLINVALIT